MEKLSKKHLESAKTDFNTLKEIEEPSDGNSFKKQLNAVGIKKQQIKDYVERIDKDKAKKISQKYKNYFELCNVNNKFLETNLIKKYPIFGADEINNHKMLYNQTDINLINEKLFEIKDEYKIDTKKQALLKPPSLSSILKLTESEKNRNLLTKWKIKKIEELGMQEFEKYSIALLNRGSIFHKTIEDYTNKGKKFEEITVENQFKPAWESLSGILTKDITKTLYSECKVSHENLCYTGKFDSVCYYKDKIYVVEWKLGDKRKDTIEDLYDYPLQLVAYLGAFLVDKQYEEFRKKHAITNVMVIHAYVDGSPPSIHCLSFHQVIEYWLKYLVRLQQFWLNVRDTKVD